MSIAINCCILTVVIVRFKMMLWRGGTWLRLGTGFGGLWAKVQEQGQQGNCRLITDVITESYF